MLSFAVTRLKRRLQHAFEMSLRSSVFSKPKVRITSNQMEGTLLSIRVESVPEKQVAYPHVAKHMLDHDINLVGIVRNGAVHLRFVDLFPAVDDVLVYIGSSRLEWETVQESLTP